MSLEHFGATADCQAVHRVTLRGGGLRASFLTWGAVLQDLRLDGHPTPLVLGFPDFAPYPAQSPFFGATVGRCANRIRDGHLEIDGKACALDRNDGGKHHLHGGRAGTGVRIWQVADVRADRLVLEITLADGEMGYPGRMDLQATFALGGQGALDITYRAQTDAATLCNPAHHSYFTLDNTGSVLDHDLKVAADHVLPVTDDLIPTGQVLSVAGSGFDFRTAQKVRQMGGRLDHNFCLSPASAPLRPVAWVHSAHSGVSLEVQTNAPGLQVYDGAGILTTAPGLTGMPMGAHAGLALEPQIWPDAHHHPHFPQAVLRPHQVFEQRNRFTFSRAP